MLGAHENTWSDKGSPHEPKAQFFNIVQKKGGKPMLENSVANCETQPPAYIG